MERAGRLEAVYGWLRGHRFETDALIAAALALALAVLPAGLGVGAGPLVLNLALLVPLAWRRTSALASGATVAAVALFQLASGSVPVPADVAVLISLYALAAYAPKWAGRVGLLVAFVGILLAGGNYVSSGAASVPLRVSPVISFLRLYNLPVRYLPLLVGFVAMLVLATWALGTLRRLRWREEERLRERTRLLEREQAQEAQLAATAERARIAREMHDVVAHSLSVTISQADGGRYAARSDPDAALEALATIAETSRQALADMRVLLGVLRQDESPQLAPQPGIEAIPDLVQQVVAGGLDVQLEVLGRARSLAAGPALAAFRIVQESLTNVLKHGGPNCRAWVRLSWGPDELELWVVDDGRGAAAAVGAAGGSAGRNAGGPAGGQGLRGMRERADLHGGRLEAQPRAGGGFGVHASLPYGRERA